MIGKNPLTVPPIEIVTQGREAILNYFEQLDEKDHLFEAKVLLVGEERAGKSTIADALVDSNFKIDINKKTTHGIDIIRWTIPKDKSKTAKDFLFNIWDFGGQEIYHTTHQFFLTKRSLYIFITESRKDLRYDDFYYWLNIIDTLAGDSPVILAQNKIDQDHKNQSIDEYRERFPQIAYDLQQISCNTEYDDWKGIYYPKLEILKENIFKILKDKKLPGIGDELPRAWVDIRKEINKLQNKNINFITQSNYFEICKDKGLDRKQAFHLSDYFHDLGVFLHFKDDIQLKNIIFINHKWVTNAIYNVFDSLIVKKAHGKFSDEDLMAIWDEPEFADCQAELLNLMKNPKFKICYQHKHHYYLAPQLFDDKPMKYEWRTIANNLRFHYLYEFMPKGILSQLIVMMHQHVYRDTFWLHGVLFDNNNTRAIVKENRFSKNNLITIQVEGESSQRLLTQIATNIEEINSSYTNLKISEEFGCCCDECKGSENPHYFKSETIKRAIKKRKSTIECQTSFEDVDIGKLLGTYIPQDQVRYVMHSLEEKIDKILVNTESLRAGQKVIIEKLDKQYAYLIQLPQNKSDLEEIRTAIEEIGTQPEMIIEDITDKIILGLSKFSNEMDNKLQEIYESLKKTDDWQAKVKLSIPLLNLFGLNIETEFDAKNWATKMYKKHEMKIFKLMGYL